MAYIPSFTAYLAETAQDWRVLDEAGLSRVLQHLATRNVGFMSAFRSEHNLSANRTRNLTLKSQIRDAGFGFLRVVGHWVENEGTSEERSVEEESFMILGSDGDDHGALMGFLRKAARNFQQEAFLYKPHNTQTVSVQYTNGTHENIGQFSLSNIGKMYSDFKGKKFVFRTVSESRGFYERLGR